MPDYDPLTISDDDLKKLPPAERGAVYKARAAARAAGTTPPASASAGASTSTSPAAGAPATPSAGAAAAPAANAAGTAGASVSAATASPSAGAATTPGAGATPAGGAPATGAAGATSAAASASAGAAGTAGVPASGAAGSTSAGAKAAGGAAKPAEAPKEPPFVTAVLAAVDGATWQWRHGYAEIKIPRDALLTAANTLRAQGFDYLSFITEVDWQDRLELVYHLYSYDYAAQPLGAILRCDLPREGMPSVASLTAVWPGAEFMEREAYEMMGIRFLGHPDLRRILLPDDFVGFPMRRDYTTDYAYVTVKSLVHESD